MATPTLSNTPSIISDCEDASDWTGNSLALDTEVVKEGSNSVLYTARLTNLTAVYNPTGTWNLQNTHIRMWFNCTIASFMAAKASGGLQIEVSDGSNTGSWYLAGSDTYQGGWLLLVVDTRRPVDAGTKPDMTIVTSITQRYATLSGSPKNVDNTWIDLVCYGDGYTVTGGSSADPITWQDLADQDEAEGWGVVQKINGVYFVNGKITLGDGSGTGSCYFKDQGELVVFLDEAVDSDLYALVVAGNGTGTTEVQMGNEVGSGDSSAGTQGIVLKGRQVSPSLTPRVEIDQTTGGTSRTLDNDGSSQGLAQSFQSTVARVVRSIDVYVTSRTPDSPADTLRVWLWEAGPGKTLIGVSDPVAVDDLTASALNSFQFSRTPYIQASTTYYWTLQFDNPDTTTDVLVVDSSGPPVPSPLYTHASPGSGVEVYDPSTWSAVSTSDVRFRLQLLPRLRPQLDQSDTDPDVISWFGCVFLDCAEFNLAATANKFVSCQFLGGGMITHDNGAEVRDGVIGGAVGTGLHLVDAPTDPELRDMAIQDCPVGMRISSAGTYNLRNIQFNGNDWDIEVTATTGTVELVVLENGSTPTVWNSGGATVTITVSATHSLTGLAQYTEVTYVTAGTTTVLYHVEDVDSTGETAYNYNAASPPTVDILIHHVDYVPILIKSLALTAAGGSIPITQYLDRVYYNPSG